MAGDPEQPRLMAPPPRGISGGALPPRPDQLPSVSKNRRRFVVPPPSPTTSLAPPPPGAPPRKEASAGVLPRALFHGTAATIGVPRPRSCLEVDVATTSLPPPRACQSLNDPMAWDTRSTASTPPFVVEDDFSPAPSPFFDWSPNPTINNTSEGFMNLMTQDAEPDLEVLTDLPTPGSGASKEKKRGTNYNHDEDIQLCDSWMSVTHDPIVANEQPSKTYWKRITDEYNENKKSSLVERTASSLEHRWGIIQKECMKFQGYFEEVERRHRSGIPYKEHLIEAQQRYAASDSKGKACSFIHCWLRARHFEKFMSLHEAMKQQKRPSKTRTPSEGQEEGHDPTPDIPVPPSKRPPGRKQSKEKLKRHEGPDELVKVWGSYLEMKMEEQKQREARWVKTNQMEERRLEIEERRLQWEQEQRIMFCDVSSMDASQRAYVLAMRAEIANAKVAAVNAMVPNDGASGSSNFSTV